MTTIAIDTLIAEANIHEGETLGFRFAECICCGRAMTEKAVDKAAHMHMTTDKNFIALADEHPRSQGCFPVGSACAAKIRKALKARGLKPRDWIAKL